jgi:general secretion pathway protein F
VSGFAAAYWWAILLAGGLAAAGLHGYVQTGEGRALRDRATLAVPLLGGIVRELEVARLARTLATLLQSGVPILTALGIVGDTVGNVVLARALPQLAEGVRQGRGIAGPLQQSGVFPPLAVHMARVGEEAGRLEEMLLRVADVYDGRVTTAIKRLLGLLEPIFILGLGLVVGAMVLSMLMAIFSISDLPL